MATQKTKLDYLRLLLLFYPSKSSKSSSSSSQSSNSSPPPLLVAFIVWDVTGADMGPTAGRVVDVVVVAVVAVLLPAVENDSVGLDELPNIPPDIGRFVRPVVAAGPPPLPGIAVVFQRLLEPKPLVVAVVVLFNVL